MKKITFFINSLEGGGAERVVSNLVKEFSNDKEFEVYFILLFNVIEYELPKNIKLIKIFEKRKRGLTNFILLPLYALKLSKILRENNITMVISYMEGANFINILSNIFFKHKIILSERVSPISAFNIKNIRGFLNIFLLKKLYPYADKTIAVTKAIKDELITLGINKQKIDVIYNPIDIDKINIKSNEKDFLSEVVNIKAKHIFINIGRLDRSKQQIDLLTAFKNIELDDSVLLLLGKGPYEEEFKKFIKKNSLENKVLLLGFVDNPYKYLSIADSFVLSSQAEGFPNVLIEAMACGLPIVSYDCETGPREILDPNGDYKNRSAGIEKTKYGYLVKQGSVKNLESAMKLVYENKNEFSKNKIIEYSKNYSLENIFQKYKKLFRSLVNEKY